MSYSVPPGLSVLPVAVIESMCAGVSTPVLVSFCARFARSIWPADAPTPNLLVVACADSAAPLSRSKNPIPTSRFPVVLRTFGLRLQPHVHPCTPRPCRSGEPGDRDQTERRAEGFRLLPTLGLPCG